MDEYFASIKNITKQLSGVGFPNAREVAIYITERNKGKIELSDDEIKAALAIKMIAELTEDDSLNAISFAGLITKGSEHILKVCQTLKSLGKDGMGYTKKEVRDAFRKHISVFYLSEQELYKIYTSLRYWGFSDAQIKEIYLDAASLGIDELSKRTSCVARHFPKENIYVLGKQFLFYQYYTDPVDCIDTLVQEFGAIKALEILKQEEMLLYLWKDEFQRDDYSHGKQHKEAVAIIEKYRNQIDHKALDERRKKNSIKECVELVKKHLIDNNKSNKVKYVIFENGTCVSIVNSSITDEQAIINEAKALLKHVLEPIADFSVERIQQICKNEEYVYKVGSFFSLINTYFWSNETHITIDDKIVTVYQLEEIGYSFIKKDKISVQ